jgi:DUF4097 and DUF4098 domain-containing protein YvlB
MGTRHRIRPDARFRVHSASGKIHIIAEDRDDLEVDPPGRRVESRDDGRIIEIQSRSTNLQLRVPAGRNVSVGAISGAVQLEGEFGSVKVSAVSGSVEVGHALGDVDIRSVSGNLSVERADGECSLNSKSGRITVGRVGRLAKAATISGKVDLTTDGAADVEVKTISGHVSLKVPPGKAPRIKFRSLAGKLRCDCEQGDDFEVRAASVSGSVDITPA